MPGANKSPKDLAEVVYAELQSQSDVSPSKEILCDLFETMYFASLRTEESQPIVFDVVFLDPDNPDPSPPERIRHDRWTSIPLASRLPFTIADLVKIAKASDPRTSSLATYHEDDQLFIWGLIDQGNSYHAFVNYDSDSGHARPGIFQASIKGIGHIAVFIEYEQIAELRINAIPPKLMDVLGGGPVLDALQPGISSYIEAVRAALPEDVYADRDHWDAGLTSYWIASLCRLLLRAQNYHHGGAVLITPDTAFQGLNVKYGIHYERLRYALERRALLQVQSTYASDEIFTEYLDQEAEEIPVDLYLDEMIHTDDLDDNRSELDGAIWFVSLLTRVDGLVLLDEQFNVQGFGVEITYAQPPTSVFVAGDRRAVKTRMREANYNHYGTRHRSMMRYCAQVPGSIGFVISQDGDVRVITQVRDRLVMWDSIKLQQHLTRRMRRRPHRASPS